MHIMNYILHTMHDGGAQKANAPFSGDCACACALHFQLQWQLWDPHHCPSTARQLPHYCPTTAPLLPHYSPHYCTTVFDLSRRVSNTISSKKYNRKNIIEKQPSSDTRRLLRKKRQYYNAITIHINPYAYTYMYTYIYIYMCVCVRVYMYMHMHMHMHMYM